MSNWFLPHPIHPRPPPLDLMRTGWTVGAEVEKIATVPIAAVELAMETLGALADGAAAGAALRPLVVAYRQWIEERTAVFRRLTSTRR